MILQKAREQLAVLVVSVAGCAIPGDVVCERPRHTVQSGQTDGFTRVFRCIVINIYFFSLGFNIKIFVFTRLHGFERFRDQIANEGGNEDVFSDNPGKCVNRPKYPLPGSFNKYSLSRAVIHSNSPDETKNGREKKPPPPPLNTCSIRRQPNK